jgi:hypothetical protein
MLTDESLIDLLSTEELLNLPPVSWLMDGMIPENGLAAIYGPPGEGKSFIALDWAMSISEGLPWMGLATKQSPVIYIAAEGGRGIQKRVRGWMDAHNRTDLHAMYYLLHPLYVREDGVIEEFLHELERIDVFPGLVILDTLSRSFGGGEENSSADMGGFIDGMTRLKDGRSMSALIVHHTNATGGRERGHTAFRGGMDAMFSCHSAKNSDGRITLLTLENVKQKDNAESSAIYLQPRADVTSTLIFEPAPPPERKKRGEGVPAVPTKASMLTILASHPEGMTFTEWLYASQVPKRTFQRRLRQVLANSEIYKEDGRYFIMPTVEDLAELADDDDEN